MFPETTVRFTQGGWKKEERKGKPLVRQTFGIGATWNPLKNSIPQQRSTLCTHRSVQKKAQVEIVFVQCICPSNVYFQGQPQKHGQGLGGNTRDPESRLSPEELRQSVDKSRMKLGSNMG